MIVASSKVSFFHITNKIFASDYCSNDFFKIVSYSTYLGEKKPYLLIKKSKSTVILSLCQSDEELLMAAKTKTRNQIRRAIKDKVVCAESFDVDEFVNFYNTFAQEKGLPCIAVSSCLKYKGSLHLTKAMYDNKTICYHAYLIDKSIKRSLLLYSASMRLSEGIDRGLIGNANRYLHYFDLCFLRDLGMDIYDFGGIYLGDKDKSKIGIAEFKQSFGGSVVKVTSYYSLGFIIMSKIKTLLNY